MPSDNPRSSPSLQFLQTLFQPNNFDWRCAVAPTTSSVVTDQATPTLLLEWLEQNGFDGDRTIYSSRSLPCEVLKIRGGRRSQATASSVVAPQEERRSRGEDIERHLALLKTLPYPLNQQTFDEWAIQRRNFAGEPSPLELDVLTPKTLDAAYPLRRGGRPL